MILHANHTHAQCKVRGDEKRGHTHVCIGPRHGYDEHLCACDEWFKAAAVVDRVARIPDSARAEEIA